MEKGLALAVARAKDINTAAHSEMGALMQVKCQI
jgi:hypothetical protein